MSQRAQMMTTKKKHRTQHCLESRRWAATKTTRKQMAEAKTVQVREQVCPPGWES